MAGCYGAGPVRENARPGDAPKPRVTKLGHEPISLENFYSTTENNIGTGNMIEQTLSANNIKIMG